MCTHHIELVISSELALQNLWNAEINSLHTKTLFKLCGVQMVKKKDYEGHAEFLGG